MTGPVWAVVVAAGQGSRFGGSKQFAMLERSSVVDLALASVASVADGAVVVLPAGTSLSDAGLAADCPLRSVAGRATRAGSVRAGLEQVPDETEIVVVHDAARPLASVDLCRRVVAAVEEGADAAIPAISLTDTVKRVEGARVTETLDRSCLVRVQTPQAFRAGILRRAHAEAAEATDDAALVEAAGGTVVIVPGEECNLKITTAADLELARFFEARLAASSQNVSSR